MHLYSITQFAYSAKWAARANFLSATPIDFLPIMVDAVEGPHLQVADKYTQGSVVDRQSPDS